MNSSGPDFDFVYEPSANTYYTAGLPDFPWYVKPKQDKNYQMNTKWSENIPNAHKIFQLFPI
jgi:hypothetical protein